MTKQQLIDALSGKNPGLKKVQIESTLDSLGEVAQRMMKDGSEIPLPGIGKLVTVKKPARTARNPGTGAEVAVPARTVVKFRTAKALKEALARNA